MPSAAHALFEQIATIREALALPIPALDLPQNLFLLCDGCSAPMRSETSFLCSDCLRTHGVTSPVGMELLDKGMDQVEAMHDAVSEARCSGRWN